MDANDTEDSAMAWRSPTHDAASSHSSSVVLGSPMPGATPIRDADDDEAAHQRMLGEGEASPAWSSMPQSPMCYAPRVFVMPEPPRFDIASEEGRHGLHNHLAQHGFAIAAATATRDEIDALHSSLWDFLEAVPGTSVRRNDADTWAGPDWLPDAMSGIVSGHGIGQAAVMWQARTLPKVRATFAGIWGTSVDELLTSFDGANAFRPWSENGRPEWRTAGGWYHVDQGLSKSGCHCVQGLLTLTDATYHTGGLVVVPGSHLQHDDLCRRNAHLHDHGGRDFLPVPITDPLLSNGALLVCARAGDLILWDSRTVHCNAPGCDPSFEVLGPQGVPQQQQQPHQQQAAPAEPPPPQVEWPPQPQQPVGGLYPAASYTPSYGFDEAWREWGGDAAPAERTPQGPSGRRNADVQGGVAVPVSTAASSGGGRRSAIAAARSRTIVASGNSVNSTAAEPRESLRSEDDGDEDAEEVEGVEEEEAEGDGEGAVAEEAAAAAATAATETSGEVVVARLDAIAISNGSASGAAPAEEPEDVGDAEDGEVDGGEMIECDPSPYRQADDEEDEEDEEEDEEEVVEAQSVMTSSTTICYRQKYVTMDLISPATVRPARGRAQQQHEVADESSSVSAPTEAVASNASVGEAGAAGDGSGGGGQVDAPQGQGLLRACCYVCMTPAAWASEQVLRQRQLGYEYNLTTSHWPHEWLPIGGPVHHLPRNDGSRLDEMRRRMVGGALPWPHE